MPSEWGSSKKGKIPPKERKKETGVAVETPEGMGGGKRCSRWELKGGRGVQKKVGGNTTGGW